MLARNIPLLAGFIKGQSWEWHFLQLLCHWLFHMPASAQLLSIASTEQQIVSMATGSP